MVMFSARITAQRLCFKGKLYVSGCYFSSESVSNFNIGEIATISSIFKLLAKLCDREDTSFELSMFVLKNNSYAPWKLQYIAFDLALNMNR
jgi:hypothetical protein